MRNASRTKSTDRSQAGWHTAGSAGGRRSADGGSANADTKRGPGSGIEKVFGQLRGRRARPGAQIGSGIEHATQRRFVAAWARRIRSVSDHPHSGAFDCHEKHAFVSSTGCSYALSLRSGNRMHRAGYQQELRSIRANVGRNGSLPSRTKNFAGFLMPWIEGALHAPHEIGSTGWHKSVRTLQLTDACAEETLPPKSGTNRDGPLHCLFPA